MRLAYKAHWPVGRRAATYLGHRPADVTSLAVRSPTTT